MESCPKVIFTLSGDRKPLDIYDDGQWEDYDDDVRFGSNFSATNFTQYNDVLKLILSMPQYKAPTGTFTDDLAFANGVTDHEFFYGIPELDICDLDDHNSFSTYPYVSPSGSNYGYVATPTDA